MKHYYQLLASALLLLLLGAGNNSLADIRLPALIADNMVLQQHSRAALWGWADPGETIRITGSWNGEAVTVTAGENGDWQASIATGSAGGPYTISIKGKNSIEISNVLLGEVWLCSGQSNMHFPVGDIEGSWATGVVNYKEEVAAALHPGIHFFTVERKVADEPQEDVKGNWEVCSPETVFEFSAVAYFFGREIHEKTGYPVGLINSSWGGTPAESWTKKEVLESDPLYRPILEQYNEVVENYPEKLAAYRKKAEALRKEGKSPPREPIGPNHNKSPYKLYNAMIAPLAPYTLKGFTWYQGESNADRAYQYSKLFPDMIRCWRDTWHNRHLPFYFVQIAPHRSQGPEIREAQLLALQEVPYTGMAVITDHGDLTDIHPRNKQVVGKRLSLWALVKDYGKKDIVYSGPVYRSMRAEGGKIRLEFDHTRDGLVAEGGELREFTIAGPDSVFVPARAVIEGNTVLVWSEEVKKPEAVRFAWKKFPEPRLFNKAGLPASPFRTDDWGWKTKGKFWF